MTISIILPTYNTPLYYLDRCIRSVVRQVYPFWQLCITDDGSSDPRVLRELKGWATCDRRICVNFREKQGGISAASNSAIDGATGEFIVLLDHDDELHPLALKEVAERLTAVPDADLIYSDEDKIDDHGRRTHPVFKPNFDADLLVVGLVRIYWPLGLHQKSTSHPSRRIPFRERWIAGLGSIASCNGTVCAESHRARGHASLSLAHAQRFNGAESRCQTIRLQRLDTGAKRSYPSAKHLG